MKSNIYVYCAFERFVSHFNTKKKDHLVVAQPGFYLTVTVFVLVIDSTYEVVLGRKHILFKVLNFLYLFQESNKSMNDDAELDAEIQRELEEERKIQEEKALEEEELEKEDEVRNKMISDRFLINVIQLYI